MTAVKAEHPDNETYRTLAQGLVSHNDHRREYATEALEDEDEPLIVHFNANTKVILDDDENKGAYVTCSIWVPNPNYEEDEEDDEE